MPKTDLTWGVVSTIKAPARDILRFAAYHLDLGAHRLHIYLDDPNPVVLPYLQEHPKIRVFTCDATYWKRLKRDRPSTHQYRQILNATHAYTRTDVTWLTHIDVDEFLWSPQDLRRCLANCAQTTTCARVRPMESLPERASLYKAHIPAGPRRDEIVRALYPKYGLFLPGGFLSHVAGKLFARTGLKNVRYRIHNILIDGVENPGQVELSAVDLCHHHAPDWDSWLSTYGFRIAKRSYRPGLTTNVAPELGGLSKHDLFQLIEGKDGKAALHRFFLEITAQDEDVFALLRDGNWIRERDLQLSQTCERRFPGAMASVAK